MSKLIKTTSVVSVLAAFLTAGNLLAEATWWTKAPSTWTEDLVQILGSAPAAWSFTNIYRKDSEEFSIKQVDGRPVFITKEKNGLILSSGTHCRENTEVTVRFRYMGLPQKVYGSFNLRAAVKDSTKPDAQDKDRVYMGAVLLGGNETIQWHAANPRKAGERVNYSYGYYYINGMGNRQLDWPEGFRRIVEHETASLRSMDETWVEVRITLLKNAYRIGFNDLTLVDYAGENFDTTGSVEIQMSAGVQLASVRIRSLPEFSPAYEPIAIGHSLNSNQINGESIERSSLPEPGKESLVQGIPFVLPGVDDRGKDHIDLGASWFQAAALEGHMYGYTGPFMGRWASPLQRNPARIRFRVPGGRYRAIHLIAASDDAKDCVPVVTAQFYREGGGYPASFPGEAPLFSAKASDVKALPVRLTNGRKGNLFLVTIPVEPGQLEGFKDMEALDIELTKGVKPYRCYPDPSFYSVHAAGLPSSVHVWAMTMERPATEMVVEPDKYAHVFTAPEIPSYKVKLKTRAGSDRKVSLEVLTTSFDGQEETAQKTEIDVKAKETTASFSVPLKKFGYHDIRFRLTDGDQVWTESLSLANLHQDTRERGNWDVGRGSYFGAWCWGGGHYTPPHEKSTLILALAGGMGQGGSYQQASDEVKKVAEKYGMATLKHFAASDHWVTAATVGELRTKSPEEVVKKMIEGLASIETTPSPITKAWYVSFFAEPHLGLITSGALPEYFGEKPFQFPEHEEERFQEYLKAFLLGAPEIRKRWPNAKINLPHGDPMFTVFFARNEEAKKYIDGCAVDVPVFERLPEQQIHQVSPHRLWMCMEEFKKAGIHDKMSFPMYEGPCVPDHDGAVPWRDAPALVSRNLLVFIGYGVNQFPGAFGVFHSGDYWGEQHYGGGMMHRLPLERPKPMYTAYATITRQLNGRNFTKWLPTGSLSVYNMQFKHYKDSSLTHVLWTIRGTRPVTLDVPAGTKVSVWDNMDNETVLTEAGGKITFTVSSAPVYLQGPNADANVTLGEPDHSDQLPAKLSTRIASLGDGSWSQSLERDKAYEENTFLQLRRYQTEMKLSVTKDIPSEKGKTALAVHLDTPEIDRVIMPYYTTIKPKRPVTISGKASHLGLWVRASSDWGRVVYSLLDAEGERWISVGTKDEWNCDDIHNWSVFCFDGWRYLRFELPSNSPYDTYRERGSTWWGHHGGDGIIDLPLKLEKVMVERRTHAMYVTQPVPAKMDDVLLADLFAEYETEQGMTREAIRLSKLRMSVPEGIPELGNPIQEMAQSGTFDCAGVTRITLPDQEADGTKCYVHFDPVEGAKSYDIWVSPYQDGKGAMKLGSAWPESGKLLTGLRQDTDFYLFLVVTNAEGKLSRPSTPYKIHLKDIFGMK
ncbi:MAG: hypothetical protein O2857_21190 [Planctomycetota bacterium]|nr:hypothetical protein [Planctomycetota bacterium]